MHVLIEKSALKDALKTLSSSVQKDGDITSAILFHYEEGALTLKASNNQVYMALPILQDEGLIEGQGEGVFAIKESRLSKWLSNVMEDTISITYTGEEAVFKAGSFECPFPTLKDLDQFPSKRFEAAFVKAEELSKVPVPTLTQALSFISPMVSDSVTTADPTGTWKIAKVKKHRISGTDTRVFALFCSDTLAQEWRISQEQMHPAMNYVKRLSEATEVTVKATDTIFFFEGPSNSFFGFVKPRFEPQDVEGISDELTEEDVWKVSKDSLKQAIGAVLATAPEDEKFLTVRIDGQGETSEMTLSMKTFGSKKDSVVSIPCRRIKGDQSLEFPAAPSLLTQVLGSFDDDFKMAVSLENSYLKLYEETLANDRKLCYVTIRKDVVI